MKRKEKQETQQTDSGLATTSHFPRHANSGGLGLNKKDQAAPFSQPKGAVKKKQKKDQFEGALIFEASDDYINDNVVYSAMLKPRLAALVALVAVLIAMNASAIITRMVMNAPDGALSVAMDISPDALSFAFNKMDVGE